jgi:hypothetical protein
MDIARLIRDRLRDALGHEDTTEGGGSNIAFSANVGTSGRSTTVYSDDDVTIIERDGERQVIPHQRDRAGAPRDKGSDETPAD